VIRVNVNVRQPLHKHQLLLVAQQLPEHQQLQHLVAVEVVMEQQLEPQPQQLLVMVVAMVVVAVVVAVVAVVEQQLLPPEQKLGLVQLHVLVVNAMDVMVIVQQKNAWLMI
jgi:hypothetical protein